MNEKGENAVNALSRMVENLSGSLGDWLVHHGVGASVAGFIQIVLSLVVLVLLAWLIHLIARAIILKGVTRLIHKSSTRWDDYALEHGVFHRLTHLVPAAVIYLVAGLFMDGFPVIRQLIQGAATIYMVIMGVFAIDAFINAIHAIYCTHPISRQKPIKGYLQVLKIFLYVTAMIIILSIIMNERPLVYLSGLGAMTAVLMLVFKDSILGFVAGVQLTTNNMVRVGDWIEMPKYGADGDVIDISLMTVKVQNWDKTISTIPVYSLISDSFKNWRGMSESGGRRIKRALYLDMTSFKFCDEAMLERFKKFQILRGYIEGKLREIAAYNQEHQADLTEIINGRRLTNVGTFRAYVEAYLHNHPKVHPNMTFLVRQLPPDDHGLPIEIYVFCTDQVWAHYEAIQADIFDHILTVVPEFELRVFQSPSGYDVRQVAEVFRRPG